jgi:ATP-dependent helicase HrpB
MPSPQQQLPVDLILPQLDEALRAAPRLVLSAPPGAGKTTRVPLALLSSRAIGAGGIIMLEPRRIAARRAAEYMAQLLGEKAGATVGYRTRGETRVGPSTRIQVVTEGVLTRLLQDDPGLPGVSLVVFDEYHERSIHADLGLALTLDVQETLRPDLRILVMSATIDCTAVAGLLGGARIIAAEGRQFPVETRYASFASTSPVERRVADVVIRALTEQTGDLLVFLPGAAEIRRVERVLAGKKLPEGVAVLPLYADLPAERQQDALAPPRSDRRKVILSTSVAETSLTIDGVTVVVDAGLARMARFDPRRGMSGLVTVPVSQASADQRRGRAGRTSPGVCYRLWTREEHERLPGFAPAEIVVADLAPLALDLARWGGGERLRFLDPPPEIHLAKAAMLLRDLGAIDERGVLTAHGQAMAALPVHPRLAHMIIRGKELGLGALACDLAALLEERDMIPRGDPPDVDLETRLAALRGEISADRAVRERILRESARLRSMLGIGQSGSSGAVGMLVGLAFPERIAQHRSGERFLMAGGTGAVLPSGSPLAREGYIAIAEVDGVGQEVRVFLAAALIEFELEAIAAECARWEDEASWDPVEQGVVARRVRRLGALALDEKPAPPDRNRDRSIMLQGIASMGLEVLPWDERSTEFRGRSEWIRTAGLAGADWPDLSGGNLLETLPEWLGPHLEGMTRRPHLSSLDMEAILRGLLSYRQLREMERLAPQSLQVPTGSRIRVQYAPGELPVLAVRLQELFGQTDTPCVGGGAVRVLVHLLSPAGRPLAVTKDLKSFWKNAYVDVRKEMRGRYPKHYWPEDPLEAAPTRQTKRHSR